MIYRTLLLLSLAILSSSCKSVAASAQTTETGNFDIKNDLLLMHFDCKTDVDDVHSAAALFTLLSNNAYSNVNYHAVTGTYGTQEGLYVPANDLFELAFAENWSDAHTNWKKALEEVKSKVMATLTKGGEVWIADAGQSDFSADLVKELQNTTSGLSLASRIHVVQHSDWNEKVTSTESLKFVKEQIDYQKIPDGNALNNGTPGFRSPEFTQWKNKIKDPKLYKIWQLAVEIGNKYNGKEGRYNNEAVAAGGLDFSDLSEVCWILGLQEIKDTSQFFDLYAF